MSVGRIDFLDKYGEIEMSMEYDCWDKMSAQIALEDRFGDPFVAHVYSNDALDFSLSSTYSKVRYLQQLITKDMGFDRYWITEKEVTAAFYNPEKGPNSGCFVVYHISSILTRALNPQKFIIYFEQKDVRLQREWNAGIFSIEHADSVEIRLHNI